MRFLTESFNPDQSAKGPRMQVISAGLPRCATSSLQAALEMPPLGYSPCMHMAHIAPSASRGQLVLDALREADRSKRHELLHEIFDGYEATTDFPGFWFIDDLMDMYPDAAIVLNQRQGGGSAWHKSFMDNLHFFSTRTYLLLCLPIKTDRLHWIMHRQVDSQWEGKFGKGCCPEFYDVYQEFVMEQARKRGRKVLVWKAQDGWGPLCEFLGKEVPKEPFPWVNDADTVKLIKRILLVRGVLSWAAILGGAYATWRLWPKFLGQGARLLGAVRTSVAPG